MVGSKGPPEPCRGWLKPGSDNKIAEPAGAGLPLAVVNGAAPPHPLEAVGGFWVWGTSGRLFEGADGFKAPDGGWGGATEVTEGSEGGSISTEAVTQWVCNREEPRKTGASANETSGVWHIALGGARWGAGRNWETAFERRGNLRITAGCGRRHRIGPICGE